MAVPNGHLIDDSTLICCQNILTHFLSIMKDLNDYISKRESTQIRCILYEGAGFKRSSAEPETSVGLCMELLRSLFAYVPCGKPLPGCYMSCLYKVLFSARSRLTSLVLKIFFTIFTRTYFMKTRTVCHCDTMTQHHRSILFSIVPT